MKLIRPAILILAAVLAPPAAAATLEEQAASAAVLEEEAVDANINSSVLLSPQAAADPGAAATQVVAATQVGVGGSTTVAWRTTGGGTWSSLSGIEPPGAAASRGAPDIAWGVGNDVWIAHLGADTSDGCDDGSGIFLSRSTNDGASFSTPPSPYAANEPAPLAPFPPYAYEDARVVMDRDSAGQPVSPIVVGGVTTYADGSCTMAVGHKVGISGPGTTSNGLATFIDDARWPSLAALPDHRIVIAYYNVALEQIVVRRYKPGGVQGLWDPEATAFLPGTPAVSVGGVAIPAAPEIAVGPDGRMHIAYTIVNGGSTDVVYAFSSDDGATWTAPVSVADGAAAGANQFLPAIAVGSTSGTTLAGGRVEVVYLDDRDAGPGYRPFLTAFAQFSGDGGPTRGGNRPLDPTTHTMPGAGYGNRLAVLATPAEVGVAPSGAAFAWWPNTNNGTSDPVKLYRSRVNHGIEAPVLTNGTIGTSKNVPVDVPDLYAATDGDGDPVRVSIIAPPVHGSFQGTTYVPAAGYAGADVVTLLADDGQPRGGTQRQIAVGNAAPMLANVGTPLRVPQGGAASLQLKATDADPGDQLRYELVLPLPTQLTNAVTLTEDGLLTVRPSKLARSTSILDVRVRVSDTSPLVGGTREALVPVKIDPQYVPFTLDASFVPTRNTAKFTVEINDEDQERSSSVVTYDWDWGDGTKHGDSVQEKHTYKTGVYAWKVTVSIRRAEKTDTAWKGGTIEVTEAGIKLVRVKQYKVSKKAKTVTIKLRSQISGSALLKLKAGKYAIKPREVVLKAQKDMTFKLSTRALRNARSASLVVRFLAVPAGPMPTPAYFSIRLR